MAEVESGGVRIAYETVGDPADPAVLLVHGFASNRSANWLRARWAEPLTDAGFFVVALDLRGHGESGRPRRLTDYGAARFRGDLVAVLDDLGIGRAHVVGYSLGARLAWDLALRHPERVRTLVLGAPAVTGAFAGFDYAAARAAHLATSAGHLRAHPAGLEPTGEPGATARYLAMATGVAGNDPHALLRVAEAQRRQGFSPRQAIPAQPMLFAVGTEDPLAEAVAELASEIPHAGFVPVPGRNHVTTVTSRDFKTAVVDFLHAHGDTE